MKVIREIKDGPTKGSTVHVRELTNLVGGIFYQVISDGPFLGMTLGFLDAIPNVKLPPKTISDLVNDAHQNAIDKGWYEEEKAFGEIIALIHSELSEALEDYRNGRKITEVYHEGEKPCGIPSELADVVIRIFDTCGFYGIDLEAAIHEKMAYNATRPKRHGGKRL